MYRPTSSHRYRQTYKTVIDLDVDKDANVTWRGRSAHKDRRTRVCLAKTEVGTFKYKHSRNPNNIHCHFYLNVYRSTDKEPQNLTRFGFINGLPAVEGFVMRIASALTRLVTFVNCDDLENVTFGGW